MASVVVVVVVIVGCMILLCSEVAVGSNFTWITGQLLSRHSIQRIKFNCI